MKFRLSEVLKTQILEDLRNFIIFCKSPNFKYLLNIEISLTFIFFSKYSFFEKKSREK